MSRLTGTVALGITLSLGAMADASALVYRNQQTPIPVGNTPSTTTNTLWNLTYKRDGSNRVYVPKIQQEVYPVVYWVGDPQFFDPININGSFMMPGSHPAFSVNYLSTVLQPSATYSPFYSLVVTFNRSQATGPGPSVGAVGLSFGSPLNRIDQYNFSVTASRDIMLDQNNPEVFTGVYDGTSWLDHVRGFTNLALEELSVGNGTVMNFWAGYSISLNASWSFSEGSKTVEFKPGSSVSLKPGMLFFNN